MKKNHSHKPLLLISLLSVLSSNSAALAGVTAWESCASPKKNRAPSNAFTGLAIGEYLSFEGGYELTPVKIHQNNISDIHKLFGTTLANAPITNYTKFKDKDWHIDALGYLPINNKYQTQLIGGIGAARTTISSATNQMSALKGTSSSNTAATAPGSKKTVLRLSAGVQQMVTDSSGLRLMMGWMNTGNLGIRSDKENLVSKDMLKESCNYGLGFFIKF